MFTLIFFFHLFLFIFYYFPSNSNSNELRISILLKISEIRNDPWQSPFPLFPVLMFMKFISLPIFLLPTQLSSTKEGFKALQSGVSRHRFPAHSMYVYLRF